MINTKPMQEVQPTDLCIYVAVLPQDVAKMFLRLQNLKLSLSLKPSKIEPWLLLNVNMKS